jgi:hypothetical protein
MTVLTSPHEKALNLLFAELEGTAAEQREAFLGTPGNLTQRLPLRGVSPTSRVYFTSSGILAVSVRVRGQAGLTD